MLLKCLYPYSFYASSVWIRFIYNKQNLNKYKQVQVQSRSDTSSFLMQNYVHGLGYHSVWSIWASRWKINVGFKVTFKIQLCTSKPVTYEAWRWSKQLRFELYYTYSRWLTGWVVLCSRVVCLPMGNRV